MLSRLLFILVIMMGLLGFNCINQRDKIYNLATALTKCELGVKHD